MFYRRLSRRATRFIEEARKLRQPVLSDSWMTAVLEVIVVAGMSILRAAHDRSEPSAPYAVAKLSRHFGRSPDRLGLDEVVATGGDAPGFVIGCGLPSKSPTSLGDTGDPTEARTPVILAAANEVLWARSKDAGHQARRSRRCLRRLRQDPPLTPASSSLPRSAPSHYSANAGF